MNSYISFCPVGGIACPKQALHSLPAVPGGSSQPRSSEIDLGKAVGNRRESMSLVRQMRQSACLLDSIIVRLGFPSILLLGPEASIGLSAEKEGNCFLGCPWLTSYPFNLSLIISYCSRSSSMIWSGKMLSPKLIVAPKSSNAKNVISTLHTSMLLNQSSQSSGQSVNLD